MPESEAQAVAECKGTVHVSS